MANPPTRPDVQTLAGATQFDGLTGTTGLLEFSDYLNANMLDENVRIKILTVAYNGGAATADVDIYIANAGAPATERIILVDANITNRAISCNLIVPKTASDVSWNLYCVTTGKTAAASLIVDWITTIVG